jgi:Tfp pilus assembly protein PilX
MGIPSSSALSRRQDERGIALLLGLLFTVIVTGICLTGTTYLKAHIQKNRTSWATKSQALQVARSGLAEAHSWLRRQTSQPVLTFAPVQDTAAVPPVLDTNDPDIGLVRDFKITGRIWARYEVWKDWAGDPDPTRLAWRQQHRCEDVSTERGAANAGAIWRLRSVGYIYNRVNPAVPFNQAPNSVIASQVATNEYRRVVIRLPGNAALNVDTGSTCQINLNGRVIGGTGAGIYYPSGTGTPSTGLAAENRVTGSPGLATAVAYDGSYEGVFGLSYDQIRAMATLVMTSTASWPNPMPENGLVVIDTGAPLVINSTRPLTGTAIVIVVGNVTMSAGSYSNFNGLLYVDGNLTMNAPSVVKGAVIASGSVAMQGIGDFATVQYDAAVLASLMTHVGNYSVTNTLMLPRTYR